MEGSKLTIAKLVKRSEKEETPEMKKRQLINKKMFCWGMTLTVLVTLPVQAAGISYFDFAKGLEGSLIVWLLTLMFLVRLFDTKKISQLILNGFLIGEGVIVIPILSAYWILIALGQEEFTADLFGFLMGLLSFSIVDAILAKTMYKLRNDLHKLQPAR